MEDIYSRVQCLLNVRIFDRGKQRMDVRSYVYSDSWSYIYFVFILQTVPELWLWPDVPDRFPGITPDFYRCFRPWRLLLL